MATDYCLNNLDMSRDTAWRGNITLVFEIWYRTRNYGYDGRYRTLLNAFVRKIELWHTCLKIGSRPKWYILIFLRVGKIAKSDYYLLHVCTSSRSNSAVTERIFMKCDIRVFFENLLRIFTLHYNLTRITGTLREDQYTFWSYRSLNEIVAQLKNCVWEMGKRKYTYKYAWILIFWKCFDSTEFNCILVVYRWHLYGLLMFNNPLLRI
jgi:hypothetical protein